MFLQNCSMTNKYVKGNWSNGPIHYFLEFQWLSTTVSLEGNSILMNKLSLHVKGAKDGYDAVFSH